MKFKLAIFWSVLAAAISCGGPSKDDGTKGDGGKGGSGGRGGSPAANKGGGGSGSVPTAGATAGAGGSANVLPSSGGAGGMTTPTNAITEGLIGYWPFDEGTGTAIKDASGKGNDGVALMGGVESSPVNPAPSWVQGRKGKALAFNGTSEWVRVPRSDSIDGTGTTGSTTVAAWVMLNQFGQAAANSYYNMIVNRHEVGTSFEHFGLGVVEGKPVSNIHFFFAQAAQVVKVNGWTHLAMTYDGITQMIYVDGVLGASADIGWPIAADTTDVTIGGAQNTNVIKEFIDGAIDEVYLYDRALSAAELGSVMNSL